MVTGTGHRAWSYRRSYSGSYGGQAMCLYSIIIVYDHHVVIVWSHSVVIQCGHRVWSYSVVMGCGHTVWS